MSVKRDGRSIDAVAQITKSGFVFVFDRVSGLPLFPIEERRVPASTLKGERAWPTQPFPVRPAPFARQSMTEADVTNRTAAAHDIALQRFHALRHNGLFTPPSPEGSVVLPGFDGGGEWGGAAADRETGVIYVNASDVPWIAAMRVSAKSASPHGAPVNGATVYATTCASCHGADRRGKDRATSLVGVGNRLTDEQIYQVIQRGRGFMPSFANLPEREKQAVITYLSGRRTAVRSSVSRTPPVPTSPYEFVGYERWRDSTGFPAIKPPWGTLNAINLDTGEYLWKIPLGVTDSTTNTGTEQYGGPIVTAGGLVFIAATTDAKFRAFDKQTGKLLWETTLPAAGFATPATYSVGGKQFVVIAAGGGKLGTKSSDTYIAFALP
jgi:quinoprotein glucose dehydrogenase